MAYITREYYENLKKQKLIEHGDWIALERMSREAGLKNGNGIVAKTFRNAVVKGFTTTDDVVKLIHGYFKPKAIAAKAQKQVIDQIKSEKLETA